MKFKLSCGLILLLGLFNCLPSEGDKCEQVLLKQIFEAVQSDHLNIRPVDDQLSKDFFDSYLAQLDLRKEFFTQKDKTILQKWEHQLDEEMTLNKLDFFNQSLNLLQAGIDKSAKYSAQILEGEIDLSRKENLETNPKKITFASDDKALKERWRKKIKLQLLQELWQKEKEVDQWNISDTKEKAIERLKASNEKVFAAKKAKTRNAYLEDYANAFLKIHDYQSEYLSLAEKASWTEAFTRSYVGLGVSLEMEDGYPKVAGLLIGGPAWKGKEVEKGDVILAIGQEAETAVDVTGMTIQEVIVLMKGVEGTKVVLTLKKPNAELVKVTVPRSEIASDLAMSMVLKKEMHSQKMGYIYLPRFYTGDEGAATHVLKELRSLRKNQVDGIILDLRNNTGGSAGETNQMLGYFLEQGPLMQSKNRTGAIRLYEDEDPDVVYDGPLLVLVNGRSASGAELFAGTMQDYGRGLVVGSPATFGKGSMQRFLDLDSPEADCPLGEVKMSIARFYTATGRSPQYTGIVPDIILPDDYALVASGERKVAFALPPENLPLEKVSQVVFTIPDLGQLKRSSAKRVKESYRFQFAQLKAQHLKDQEEQSQVTLEAQNFAEAKAAKKKTEDSFQQIFMPIDGFNAYAVNGNADRTDSVRMAREQEMKNRLEKDPYLEECFYLLEEMGT